MNDASPHDGPKPGSESRSRGHSRSRGFKIKKARTSPALQVAIILAALLLAFLVLFVIMSHLSQPTAAPHSPYDGAEDDG